MKKDTSDNAPMPFMTGIRSIDNNISIVSESELDEALKRRGSALTTFYDALAIAIDKLRICALACDNAGDAKNIAEALSVFETLFTNDTNAHHNPL